MSLVLLLSRCAILFVVFVSVTGRCKLESDLTKMEKYTLYEHNRWRRLHKNTPDLCYGVSDETHTYTPTEWSAALLKSNIKGTFGLPVSDNADVGENSYWSCINSDIEPLHYHLACMKWYGEMNHWRYRKSSRLPYEFMLRFTQLVWKSSLEVNCGWSVGVPGIYVTCQYYPRGNDRNRMEEFVEDPKTSWDDIYWMLEDIEQEDMRRYKNKEPLPDPFEVMEEYETQYQKQLEKEQKEEENEGNGREEEKEENNEEENDSGEQEPEKKNNADEGTERDESNDSKTLLLWDKLVDAVDLVQDIIDSDSK